MKRSFLLPLLVFGALPLTAAEVPSWPAFRGPNSSGVSDTAKPPVVFGPKTNVLWQIQVPGSPSSPCIWGDHLFLTTFVDGKLEVRGYDRRNGKLRWRRPVPATELEDFHGTEGSPAASTPATDGRRVVSYFGSCGLVCHDFDGEELWRYPLPVAQTAGGFGSGTSPIIVGDLVLLNRDLLKNSSLFAVKLSNGTKAWETPRPEATTSYGTPIVWRNDGATEVAVPGSLLLKGYDLATGAQRWQLAGMPSFTCTTPVVGDGLLFFAGWSPGKADMPFPPWESVVEKADKDGDGRISFEESAPSDKPFFKAQDLDKDGYLTRQDWDQIRNQMAKGENVLIALKPGGQGTLTATNVTWKFTRGLPYVSSPLYYRGRVYLVKDGGMVSCFDARTGKPIYTQERIKAAGSYYASPVAADGRIYLASLDGKVSVIKANSEQPEILHEADFGERIAATPALVENRLYVRTGTKLYALGE